MARSQLKATEDYNVGKSIVHGAETVLRTKFNLLMEQFNHITVIGFGKIGQSIADHLRQKGIRISIYDQNPITMLTVKSKGFNVIAREKIFEVSDMVFCATGNKALNVTDLKNFKKK